MPVGDKNIIRYDRLQRKLTAPDFKHLCWARLMQASHLALAPVRYLGISRVHNAINKLFNPTTDTVVIEGACAYRFPSNDYYWNVLLDGGWYYERELDVVMARCAKLPFVFLDLGANYGYWSAKVAAGLFGVHRIVAVEASGQCLPVLRQNVAGSQAPVAIHHRAIDEVSGRQVKLFGDRHAGCSIDETWYGASAHVADTVETISIDDLLALEGIDPAVMPVLVKLDVEGVELRALKGAARASKGASMFVVEDADKAGVSEALHYVMKELGMRLFVHENESDTFREITSLDEVAAVKGLRHRLQCVGLNFFATSSPLWIEALK